MWLFTYGMLMCKVKFEYEKKLVGQIKGFSRRFYHLSLYGRGTAQKPGRVLTLIPDEHEVVWGVAYELPDRYVNSILGKLSHPEIDGYEIALVKFFPKKMENQPAQFTKMDVATRQKIAAEKSRTSIIPRKSVRNDSVTIRTEKTESGLSIKGFHPGQTSFADSTSDTSCYFSDKNAPPINPPPRLSTMWMAEEHNTFGETIDANNTSQFHFDFLKAGKQSDLDEENSVDAVTYISTPSNLFYSFEEDDYVIATQISEAGGTYGANEEYVTEIAKIFRKMLPKTDDDHLFTIEHKVLNLKTNESKKKYPTKEVKKELVTQYAQIKVDKVKLVEK